MSHYTRYWLGFGLFLALVAVFFSLVLVVLLSRFGMVHICLPVAFGARGHARNFACPRFWVRSFAPFFRLGPERRYLHLSVHCERVLVFLVLTPRVE